MCFSQIDANHPLIVGEQLEQLMLAVDLNVQLLLLAGHLLTNSSRVLEREVAKFFPNILNISSMLSIRDTVKTLINLLYLNVKRASISKSFDRKLSISAFFWRARYFVRQSVRPFNMKAIFSALWGSGDW